MNHATGTLVAAAWLALAAGAAQAQTTRGTGEDTTANTITAGEAAALLGGGGGGVIRIDESAFQAGSGLITFSELPLGTNNPVYAPATYGGAGDDPQVSFGGFFQGQSLGDASTCPPGAALSGCVIGDATAPLAFAPGAPVTMIVNDGANPTSPVLSGSPTFNGPIAILFDSDVAGVGLDGGFFDNVGGTAITAFARDGSVIGSVLNEETEIEFLGLVTADGSDTIAGLLFSLVGAESAGFAIDNVRFGTGDVVQPPGPPAPPEPVPTSGPLALLLLLLGLCFVAIASTRRQVRR
jgi:hypothetical protein